MNRIQKLSAIAVVTLGMLSCVQDDDYNSPDISIKNPNIPEAHITTFQAIISRYEQAVLNGSTTIQIQDEQDLYIKGYVISSDQAGNFFKTLIIQNKTDDSDPIDDPRLGLKIEINANSLYTTFEFGRKVYVKMNGLSIGLSNGVVTIGKGDANTIKQIQPSEYQNIIIRSAEVATLTPKTTSLFEITKKDRNTLLQLHDMQVNRHELGRTFAGESFDEFDGFRVIENCHTRASTILQTSTFSDFKSLLVPPGKGTIQGILTRDFRDDFDVFIINSTSNIHFKNERCDPLELDCGLADRIGTSNLFYENFESQKNNTPIEGNGWTNYIESGSVSWEAYSSTATNASLGRSARFRSSSSGDDSNIGWLITPAINLDNQSGEILRFKTSNSLADGSFLEVLYTLDWDGTPPHISTATWGVLSAAYIVKDTDSFVPWFNSGSVDLSCATGTMHIAFKYTGSGQEGFDGIYELDEVRIDYAP
ncbi:DUF5689 domain-containing protein [Mariniflexile ostreae]|uniref:DUF5689 domain-containing protein n=1 Tax=Mariniflexile ostreae TaxID=1520892 RepID=A0ABV5FBS8_9FLAO